MTRCHWFLVFILGCFLSVTLLIISEILKLKLLNYLKDTNRPFILMDYHQLQPVDEDRLGLIVGKPQELSETPQSAADEQGLC